MNLDWLESFAAFAEELNFTRAAERLRISQPALFVQVGKLAREAGAPLYIRKGRTLELTAEGRRAEALAREILGRTAGFAGEVRGGPDRGPVVLCAAEGAHRYLLGDAIRAFTRRSEASLRLLTADRDGTVEALASGRAHVGVAVLDGVPEGLEAATLTDVEQVLVMPEGHPLARSRTVSLEGLEGRELVVPPPGRPLREALARALAAKGITWRISVECHGWEVMMRFVGLGMGLAVVNGCCQVPRGLTARPIRDLPPVRYRVLRRRGRRAGPAAELEETLMAHASAWRKAAGLR